MTPVRPPRIQALERAERLLDLVARHHPQGIPLARLAPAAGLHRSTAFSLLSSMVALGLLDLPPDGRGYRLGMKHLMRGLAVQRGLDLTSCAGDALRALCRATGETVNLAVPGRDAALIVESVEGTYAIRATGYVGTPSPYHATACGKAILAFLPDEERAALLALPLRPHTPRTITDPAALDAELARVRATDCAFDMEEHEPGGVCIARPVRDALGRVCGAISVAGIAQRMDEAARESVADLLRDAVRRIERRMQGTPDPTPSRPLQEASR
ncbi:IclR family transcriptional regulator [Roseomonas sp. AR75]|uniref:IclR family transcriptional regulator n=1 Tax=Roseomonas sp. AR75 TaxID=2562311 RepID=UPI0010C13B93|nr:IclR family transcriptional regulator [Roseomonas sp. AR75]